MADKEVTFDHCYRPKITEDLAVDLVYKGFSIPENSVVDLDPRFSKHYEQFYYSDKTFDYTTVNIDLEEYHNLQASKITLPTEYATLNIVGWVLSKCESDAAIDRANQELKLYSERNLLDLLRFMLFLVEHLRDEQLVWGLGRGSSVASYVLYLIGVHKVDSLKYDLDISEFLKE